MNGLAYEHLHVHPPMTSSKHHHPGKGVNDDSHQTNDYSHSSRKRSRSADDDGLENASDDGIESGHPKNHQSSDSLTSESDTNDNNNNCDHIVNTHTHSNNILNGSSARRDDGAAIKLRKTESEPDTTTEIIILDNDDATPTQSLVTEQGIAHLPLNKAPQSNNNHGRDIAFSSTCQQQSQQQINAPLAAQLASGMMLSLSYNMQVSHSCQTGLPPSSRHENQDSQPPLLSHHQTTPPLILHRPSASRGPRGLTVASNLASQHVSTSTDTPNTIPEYIIDTPISTPYQPPLFSSQQSIQNDLNALVRRQGRQPVKWPMMAEPHIRSTACRKNDKSDCLLEIKAPSIPRELLDRIDIDVVIIADALFYNTLHSRLEDACRTIAGEGARVRVYWTANEKVWDDSSPAQIPENFGNYPFIMQLDRATELASNTQQAWASNWEGFLWQNNTLRQASVSRSCTIFLCGTGGQPTLDRCKTLSTPSIFQSVVSEKLLFQAPIHTIGSGGWAPYSTLSTLSKMTGGIFQALQRNDDHIVDAIQGLIVKIRKTAYCSVSVQVDCVEDAEFLCFYSPASKCVYDSVGSNPCTLMSLGDMWSDELRTLLLHVALPSRDVWPSDDGADYDDLFDEDITPYVHVTVFYIPILPSPRGPILRKRAARACYVPNFSTTMPSEIVIALERSQVANSVFHILESMNNRPHDWPKVLDRPIRQILDGYDRRRQYGQDNREMRKLQLGQVVNCAETLQECYRHFAYDRVRDSSENWTVRFWHALSLMYHSVMERSLKT
ncbi:hypothetical protein SeLEV6574_g00714 [Synchytrium endobioticum]|uniref:Uncharacterized protein n=1 Tax=Synchytrium endobioticum TaxID=286115 RepID=A0A507DHR7_9FUNG|nr:hypothetical protein SeLEV6574_g00714 [Synchytrium endobioticum]